MAKTFTFLVVILMATSLAAFGNIVVGTPAGTGAWYAGVVPDTNPVDAFWDNPSKDNSVCNIGYWLNATSWPPAGCGEDFKNGGGGPGVGNWEFFADTSGGVTPKGDTAVGWYMQFPQTTQTTGNLDLQLEIAGNRGVNEFGYYLITKDQNNNVVKGALQQLYAGGATPDGPSSIASFSLLPGSMFGFYIKGADGYFYSSDIYDGNPEGSTGKLAVFRENGRRSSLPNIFWIAAEDLKISGEGIGDYNDFVVKLTVVPEPGFYGLLAVGMSALLLAVRRRRQV